MTESTRTITLPLAAFSATTPEALTTNAVRVPYALALMIHAPRRGWTGETLAEVTGWGVNSCWTVLRRIREAGLLATPGDNPSWVSAGGLMASGLRAVLEAVDAEVEAATLAPGADAPEAVREAGRWTEALAEVERVLEALDAGTGVDPEAVASAITRAAVRLVDVAGAVGRRRALVKGAEA